MQRRALEIRGFQKKRGKVAGADISYWIGGRPEGHPVLLWHGFLGTSFSWHKVMPLLAESWVALRILASSHTNPMFVLVGGKPIRASRQSAEWCLAAVHQCWTQKAPNISPSQISDAKRAYDQAADVYRRLIADNDSAR